MVKDQYRKSSLSARYKGRAGGRSKPVGTRDLKIFRSYGNEDVVLGRGNGIAVLPGNKKFRGIVNGHKKQYHGAPRSEKNLVTKAVVEIIRANGGHFLERVKSYGHDLNAAEYREVSYAKALEKTCQALREKKSLKVKKVVPAEQYTSDEDEDSWIEEEQVQAPTSVKAVPQRIAARNANEALKKQAPKIQTTGSSKSKPHKKQCLPKVKTARMKKRTAREIQVASKARAMMKGQAAPKKTVFKAKNFKPDNSTATRSVTSLQKGSSAPSRAVDKPVLVPNRDGKPEVVPTILHNAKDNLEYQAGSPKTDFYTPTFILPKSTSPSSRGIDENCCEYPLAFPRQDYASILNGTHQQSSTGGHQDIETMDPPLPPHLTRFFSDSYSASFEASPLAIEAQDSGSFPPHLASFFSGIYAGNASVGGLPVPGSERRSNHPGMDLDPTDFAASNSLCMVKETWDAQETKPLAGCEESAAPIVPRSPPTVMELDFMDQVDIDGNASFGVMTDDLDDDFFVEDFRHLMG